MIIEYHRPDTINDALKLLARTDPPTYPLGGGSVLNRPSPNPIAVVDLQMLGLNSIDGQGNTLNVGATVTLQRLLDVPGLQPALREAIRLEKAYNLRQIATVAGTLVAANGRSPFTTACLALGITLEVVGLEKEERRISLGDLLPMRSERFHGSLIKKITLPLNARLAYEYVARTPADRPIICVALARWQSGRTRLTLGGYGDAPVLVLDGPGVDGIEIAAQSAYEDAGDEWASAEYRREIAGVLALRCLQQMAG